MRRLLTVRAWMLAVLLIGPLVAACSGATAPTAPATSSAPAASAPTAAAVAPTASVAAPATSPAAPTAPPATTAAAAAPTAVAPAPTATVASEPAPTAPAAVAAGQEIRIPTTEPPSLDPGIVSDSQSIEIIFHIFEGLLGRDADGKLVPRIAERWDASPDGLTYTFHLADGPKWTDGKPVVAGDFEWAWKRNIDPKTASRYATSLFPIKNAERISKGELDPQQLGVNAQDDRTLVVTLEQPAAHFLTLAATWTLMPLPRDAIERHGDKWVEVQNIVTNGPYRLAEWVHEQRVVLERDDAYWGRKPQIQRAIYTIFPDDGAAQALAAYEAGELDTLGTTMNIPAEELQRVKADPALGYLQYDFSGSSFLAVNHRNPQLKDARVRKALGMTIDRGELLKNVLKAAASPAQSLHPPGIAGRNPELWPQEDVAAAQKLLAEAGYPEGEGFPDLSYTYSTNPSRDLMAQYLQQRWKDTLGIDVKLQNMEWKVFLDWSYTDDWKQNGGLIDVGWFSDYEDPFNYFNLLWSSSVDAGQYNTGWKNDRYDALVADAAGETNPQQREQLYGQAEQILAEDYPIIPVYHLAGETLVRPYVKGFKPARVGSLLPLESMSVEPH